MYWGRKGVREFHVCRAVSYSWWLGVRTVVLDDIRHSPNELLTVKSGTSSA